MLKSLSFVTLIILAFSLSAEAQKSPRMSTESSIGDVKVSIDYGAPYVKGRTIWGGLEKYDAVWRAGANKNTTISFDKDVKLSGKNLPAGKYGFFIIPRKEGKWTVIFSKKNDAWGSYSYDEAEDALRLELDPVWGEEIQEQLSYSIEGSNIVFAWEKAKLLIPVG